MTLSHKSSALGFPSLTVRDWKDLQVACRKVFDLMKDGAWHHAAEIIKASGQREGLRRMRELRGIGFTVEEKRLNENSRLWVYRLILDESKLELQTQIQDELF